MPAQAQNSSFAMLVPGFHGLPKVLLSGPEGSRAEIYLHGAHLTSWIPAVGEERLFLSRASEFNPSAAIRGGVPVIFPQFSSRGPLPKHGFARKMEWELTNTEMQAANSQAEFLLKDNPATHSIWPHPFAVRLVVALGGRQLDLTLTVQNTGLTPFTFSAALHTYLAVADIQQTAIEGLEGRHYIDSANDNRENVQLEKDLVFNGEVDRLYPSVSGGLALKEAGRRLVIQAQGFQDVVVWNPGAEKGAALADLEPEGYRRMVCVEAAAASSPVSLQPSAIWSGVQSLSCV